MKKMKRREMLAGLGAGTLLSFGLIGRETKAAACIVRPFQGRIIIWDRNQGLRACALTPGYWISPPWGCYHECQLR